MTTGILETRERYKNDRRAYFKEVLRVRSRHGDGLTNLDPTPAQDALLRLIERVEDFNLLKSRHMKQSNPNVRETKLPVEIVILKPRKEGMSTLVEALAFHMCEFRAHTNALVMAHRRDGAENIAAISRRFFQSMKQEHESFKVPMKRSRGELLEWGEWEDEAWDSRIVIASAANESVARGFDFDFLHISEVAHFRSSDAISAAKNALTPSGDYYVFEESTANGMDKSFFASWRDALEIEKVLEYWDSNRSTPPGWNGKFRFFWAWFQDPDYRKHITPEYRLYLDDALTPEERELKMRYSLEMEQLAWRRDHIRNKCSEQTAMSPEDFFRQEMPSNPEEAFVSSGNNVFSSTPLIEMKRYAQEVVPPWHGNVLDASTTNIVLKQQQKNASYSQVRIYEQPRKDANYVIGCKAGEQKNSDDFSVCVIFDRTNGSKLIEVGSYHGRANGIELANIVYRMAIKFNGAFIVPLARKSGVATAQHLAGLGYPMLLRANNLQKIGQEQNQDSFTPGFSDKKDNIVLAIEHTQHLLSINQLQLKTFECIEQMMRYTTIDGEFTAPEESSDDFVLATAIACYAHLKAAPAIIVSPEPRDSIQNATMRKIRKSRRTNRAAKNTRQWLPKVDDLFT